MISYCPTSFSFDTNFLKTKTNKMFRWTTSRRGEYDTQSLDRRLVRGGGGQLGGHLRGGGGHLGGGLIDGNHLSDHLTKHLGKGQHIFMNI